MQGTVTISADVEQQIKRNAQMAIESNINAQGFKLISAEDADILDSGAMEHSSDSDYEPPGTRMLKQVVVTKHNGIGEFNKTVSYRLTHFDDSCLLPIKYR